MITGDRDKDFFSLESAVNTICVDTLFCTRNCVVFSHASTSGNKAHAQNGVMIVSVRNARKTTTNEAPFLVETIIDDPSIWVLVLLSLFRSLLDGKTNGG